MVVRRRTRLSHMRRLAIIAAALLPLTSLGCRPLEPAATAETVSPPPRYQVIDLGDLRPTDINDKGQVVGYVGPGWDPVRQRPLPPADYPAFLWENGKRHALTLPTVGRSYNFALNNKGQIACVMVWNKNGWTGDRAALWDDGKTLGMGMLPGGSESEAYAVNEVGQVVGKGDDRSRGAGNRALLWEMGKGMRDLGTLGGVLAEAHDINNRGEIVGWSHTGQFSLVDRLKGKRSYPMRGFFWKDGKMHDVGVLPGDQGSRAEALNESGQVVGVSWHSVLMKMYRRTDPVPLHRGFLWEKGVMRLLPPLPEYRESYVRHLNDRTQAVGNCRYYREMQYGLPQAALWQDRRPYNLNDLIPADSGWTLHDAWKINNRGQIIGWGKRRDKEGYFLLTPVMSPADEVP
jgi:probable HAF family extracellular repeat protein